jgi:hypothetical protein
MPRSSDAILCATIRHARSRRLLLPLCLRNNSRNLTAPISPCWMVQCLRRHDKLHNLGWSSDSCKDASITRRMGSASIGHDPPASGRPRPTAESDSGSPRLPGRLDRDRGDARRHATTRPRGKALAQRKPIKRKRPRQKLACRSREGRGCPARSSLTISAFVVSAGQALRLSGERRPRQSLPLEPGDDAGILADQCERRVADEFGERRPSRHDPRPARAGCNSLAPAARGRG